MTKAKNKPPKPTREHYPCFVDMPTRWADNDIYGHVNNVAYYAFFDTAINTYLIDQCGLDIHGGEVIGLVIETGCVYHAPVAFPDKLELGIRVRRIGTSSVIYEVGVFKQGLETVAAEGKFVHVYVDETTRRPTPLPEKMRDGLLRILAEDA